ncbi:MAG: ATP-binding cassette domain-containing protein [Myxococcota bacterium]
MIWQLEGITKHYDRGRFPFRESWTVLDEIDLGVVAGERVAVVGPSGSGKSTLIRCGLQLIPRTSGRIQLFGESTEGWSRAQWRAIRRRVQLLVQNPRAMLHPEVPVGALLTESASLHGHEQPQMAAEQALQEVGLGGRGASLPRQLSGGEQRRVGLARVLLAKPELLVVDEPTAGLDAAVKRDMLDLMLARATHAAVVMVSHDLKTVARVCHRVVVLAEGRVVEQFRTRDVDASFAPSHPVTAELLGAAGLLPSEVVS